MNSAKISVIIPTYNRADLLPRALDSVLSQTLPPDEILVIDDGSTDNTAEAIKPYLSRGVQYLPKQNGGASSARNLGIQSAKGEFLAFLDSDDEWKPMLLEKTLDMLKQYPSAGVAYSDASWVANNKILEPAMNWAPRKKAVPQLLNMQPGFTGCFDRKRFRYAQLHFSLVQMSAVLVRAEVFSKAGLFDSKYDPAEDYQMWLRISRFYDFCYIDQPLGAIHVHGTNLTVRPELRENFRRSNRMALKAELAWEIDPNLKQVILDRINANWETEIEIRLREGNLPFLKTVLHQARADGWHAGNKSMRRIKTVDRLGPLAGLAFCRLLTVMGR